MPKYDAALHGGDTHFAKLEPTILATLRWASHLAAQYALDVVKFNLLQEGDTHRLGIFSSSQFDAAVWSECGIYFDKDTLLSQMLPTPADEDFLWELRIVAAPMSAHAQIAMKKALP